MGIAEQLQAAAPALFPLRVEVDDQVEPPVPALTGVEIEIHVRIQRHPVTVLVGAAAQVPRVVDQSLDARELADRAQEFRALDGIVQALVGRPDTADAVQRRLAARRAVVAHAVAALERRERGQQLVGERRGKEIIDDHVRKRRRRGELGAVARRGFEDAGIEDGKAGCRHRTFRRKGIGRL
jgi:hypothetical protein